MGLFGKAKARLPGKDHPGNEMKGYSGNFDSAPVSMADDGEEEDDDEEDIGMKKSAPNDLTYNSDEELEITNAEEELI